jgi:hypothetical protein
LTSPFCRSRARFQISPTTTGDTRNGTKYAARNTPRPRRCALSSSASAVAATVVSTTRPSTNTRVSRATRQTSSDVRISA